MYSLAWFWLHAQILRFEAGNKQEHKGLCDKCAVFQVQASNIIISIRFPSESLVLNKNTRTCTAHSSFSELRGIMMHDHGPSQASHSCYIPSMQDFSLNNITHKVAAQFREEYLLQAKIDIHALPGIKENTWIATRASVRTSKQQPLALLWKRSPIKSIGLMTRHWRAYLEIVL